MTPPSHLAYVPFISVENMMRLIHSIGIETMLRELADAIEHDFTRWPLFDKTPRVGSHSEVGVIELMPTSDGDLYGFKYVNGHPSNTKQGLQTVTAFGLLAQVSSGYPVLLSEMTVLTALQDGRDIGNGGAAPGAEGRQGDGGDRQWRPVRIPGTGFQGGGRHRGSPALRHRRGGDRQMRPQPRRLRTEGDPLPAPRRRRWKARRSSPPALPISSTPPS